jgi:phage regulator Rha-like protein
MEMGDEKIVDFLKEIDSRKKEFNIVGGNDGFGGSAVSKVKRAKMLALENIEEFYYTTGNVVYVKVLLNNHSEIIRTDSKFFKLWLIHLFEFEEDSILSDSDIKMVISSLDSTACFGGEKVEVYLRIAEKNGKIYLDLCNEKRQVLEISSDGFKVLDESPILFRRTDDMDEIPIPIFEKSRDYTKLGNYLNFDSLTDLDLIVAFILASFRPDIPKPILNLTGEAGTGKSMNSRLIRKLIDPAKKKDLLKKEISMKELPLAATNQYLLAFDNLSGISKEGSDLLCVVCTGGVMTARTLYTNSDEEIVDLRKTVILNGIDDIAKRQDLVSRTLFIALPRLKDSFKKSESEIWEAFNADYPYILGSIVNAISYGLRNRGTDTSSYPRMMDFGRFVAECAPALGWEEGYWQNIYSDNQSVGIQQSIESDPFAVALVEMMESLAKDKIHIWQGTSSDILKVLADKLPHEDTIYNKAWPKYNQVKGRLRRIAPLIAAKGITWEERKSNGDRLIVIHIE